MKGREESRQWGFFFAGDVASQEQRGKQCIFTGEIKLWPKEGERLDRERKRRGLWGCCFLAIYSICNVCLSSPPSLVNATL